MNEGSVGLSVESRPVQEPTGYKDPESILGAVQEPTGCKDPEFISECCLGVQGYKDPEWSPGPSTQ